MRAEILDERFRPVAGYAAADRLPLDSGLGQVVRWKERDRVECTDSACDRYSAFLGVERHSRFLPAGIVVS